MESNIPTKLVPVDTIILDSANDFRAISPIKIAVTPDENIFLLDRQNNCVHVYEAGKGFVHQFGQYGNENGYFDNPSDINIDNLYIYVLDANNSRIQKFDINTYEFDSSVDLRSKDSELFQITSHSSFAITSSVGIYVLDEEACNILILDQFGRLERKIAGYGSEDGKFFQPHDIATDGQRRIYISDTVKGEVQILSNLGNFLNKVSVSVPSCLSVDGGYIFVIDDATGELLVISDNDVKRRLFIGENIMQDVFFNKATQKLYLCEKSKILIYKVYKEI